MANVVDLLGSTNIISKRNPSISKPFMFYQLFAITLAILAPATICLLIAGRCFVYMQPFVNPYQIKRQEEEEGVTLIALL